MIFLTLYILLIILAARMASKRGRSKWVSVLLSLLFSPVVAIIVYLIIGEKEALVAAAPHQEESSPQLSLFDDNQTARLEAPQDSMDKQLMERIEADIKNG